MANLTYYLADKLIDHMTGKTAYTSPTVYVGLSTTTPTLASTSNWGVTEPSTGSYARVATTGATWNAAATNAATNAAAITFPTATGNWSSSANMTYALLWDASTGGNLLAFGALSTPQPVLSGNTASIPISDLSITFS